MSLAMTTAANLLGWILGRSRRKLTSTSRSSKNSRPDFHSLPDVARRVEHEQSLERPGVAVLPYQRIVSAVSETGVRDGAWSCLPKTPTPAPLGFELLQEGKHGLKRLSESLGLHVIQDGRSRGSLSMVVLFAISIETVTSAASERT